MTKIYRALALVAALLLGSSLALAHDDMDHDKSGMAMEMAGNVMVGDLEISDAFTRATPPNAPTGGAFLTITNKGDSADRLLGGTSPASNLVQVHDMKMNDGVMVMRELTDGLEIPAGGTVSLTPGGMHLMLVNLKSRIMEGTPVEVTLKFEHAGEVTISLPVAPLGATGMPMETDHNMMMKD